MFGICVLDIIDNLLIVLMGIVMLIVFEMEKVIRFNVYVRVKKWLLFRDNLVVYLVD